MSKFDILFGLSVIFIAVGLAKVVVPERFLECRARCPRLSRLSLYSSLYEGPKAKLVVRINGWVLVVVGFFVLVSVLIKQ